MNLKTILIIFTASLVFSGCHWLNPASEGKEVARVGDTYLYKDELKGVVPASGSAKDSAEAVQNYIKNWIKQQVVLQKAEANLPEYQLDVEQKLEDYRRTLIVYRYQTELIRQKLDTNVSNKEIRNYYEEHKEEFKLRDNIVKVQYVKVRKDAPNQRQLKSFMRSDDPGDRQKLREFCDRYAVTYFLDDNSWLYFNDLLKEIPIETYNQENYLKNNRYVVEEDSLFRYYINIKGFRIKESLSPLAFEKGRIRDMIINKRKMELISLMEDAVLNEAHNKGNIEIFSQNGS